MNNLNENLASITMRGSKRKLSSILCQAKGRFPFLRGHCPPSLAGSAQTLSPSLEELGESSLQRQLEERTMLLSFAGSPYALLSARQDI